MWPPNTITKELADELFNIIDSDGVLVNVVNTLENDDIPVVQLFKILPGLSNSPANINHLLAQG